MSHRAIISLGSNTPDKVLKLKQALAILGPDVVESTCAYGDPVDNNIGHPYLNIIAVIETASEYDDLRKHFKEIERLMGRDRLNPEVVAIDIDIVIFDDKIMRPADYERPYFQTGVRLMHDPHCKIRNA